MCEVVEVVLSKSRGRVKCDAPSRIASTSGNHTSPKLNPKFAITTSEAMTDYKTYLAASILTEDKIVSIRGPQRPAMPNENIR